MITQILFALLLATIHGQELRPSGFVPLTLGSIQPQGWLKDQLTVQIRGMSGIVDEVWPDVAQSQWLGGWAEGWERFPIYYDGFVSLAIQTGDPTLLKKLHNVC
jgi:hypothetical protein